MLVTWTKFEFPHLLFDKINNLVYTMNVFDDCITFLLLIYFCFRPGTQVCSFYSATFS